MSMLKPGLIRNTSRFFVGVGVVLSKVFPYLDTSLKQSGISKKYNIRDREYLSVCFLVALFVFLIISLSLFIILRLGGGNALIGPVFGAVVGAVVFLYFTMYPKSIVSRRVKYLERNLLFALRSILIQIRSGIPIFNTFVSISTGNYGPVSKEFAHVVERARSGTSVVDALEELAVRNPSIYFRRALWQLVNGLKSGADVGDNLENVIESLSKEQLVEIRRYKSVLNPLAMMYMMVAVIMPSLGITMIIILASFPGMGALGDRMVFYGLLAFTVFLQVIFIGIIKSKRPNLLGD